MQVFTVGVVFAGLSALALVAALRGGLRPAAVVPGFAAPLSASAAMTLGWAGGASVPVMAVAAAGFAAAAMIGAIGEGMAGGRTHMPAAAGWLIAFALIAVIGAFTLPRVFAGATLVFPLDRTVEGVTGGALKLPLAPLRPNAGAVTQSGYLVSSVILFLAAVWGVRRDAGLVAAALWAATVSQLVFAALDAAQWSGMAEIRTAAYRIAPDQVIAGLPRLTGAATEPSQFGAISATLFAWHLWRWRAGARGPHLVAGFLMAGLVAASLSTTALATVGLATAVFLLGALMRPSGAGFAALLCLSAASLTGLAAWLAVGPWAEPARAVLDAMFADKLASESGIERAAWARQAMVNFIETGGLGAGLGAAKASGWATAVLGQTGLPGALLITAFLAAVLLPRPVDQAARAAALTILAAALMSEARVDLGWLFFLIAGALAARPAPRSIFASERHVPAYP